MMNLVKKTVVAFSIGLAFGSAFAANRKPASVELEDSAPIPSREIVTAGDAVYAQSETFPVRHTFVEKVKEAMVHRGLEEDVDFAWVSKETNPIVNFVCYSEDCLKWAKGKLNTIATAPTPVTKVDYHQAWKDPAIEGKEKAREQTEEEQMRERQLLRYRKQS